MKRLWQNSKARWGAALGLLTGVGLTIALTASGCSESTTAAAQAATDSGTQQNAHAARVQTIRVERQDLVKTVEMPATIQGLETADLYAKVGGYLEEIAVDIGDAVYKGQVLARLAVPEMEREVQQKQALLEQAQADAEQAEAAIRQVEAQLTSSRAALDEAKTERVEREATARYRQVEYQRYQNLVDSQSSRRDLLDQAKFQNDAAQAGVKSADARIQSAQSQVAAAEANLAKAQADYKSAQARIRVAQANLDYVETMLQYGTIRAPFDGYVLKRWVDAGAFVQPADGNSAAKPLLSVAHTETVRVILDIPMQDVRLLELGDRVVLDRINVLPGVAFDGVVKRFSPSLNIRSRLMRVEIELENPEGKLRPGYYGYLTIFLDEQPQTAVIPSSALLADEGHEQYVFVAENGMARKRVVTVDYQDGTKVGIVSGLSGGEQVVKAGGGQLVDGQPLEAVLESD